MLLFRGVCMHHIGHQWYYELCIASFLLISLPTVLCRARIRASGQITHVNCFSNLVCSCLCDPQTHGQLVGRWASKFHQEHPRNPQLGWRVTSLDHYQKKLDASATTLTSTLTRISVSCYCIWLLEVQFIAKFIIKFAIIIIIIIVIIIIITITLIIILIILLIILIIIIIIIIAFL